MIAWLEGQIVDKPQAGKLILNVQGVGYDVETSLNTFFQLDHVNGPIALHVHTIVREDAFLLYGFLDKDERALFRALIKVNGVGPKSAMAILSSTTPGEFVRCIQQNDAGFLTKLPGIGKKTAERLLIEMRDKVQSFAFSNDMIQVSGVREEDEAVSALEALGYKAQEASKVVTKIQDGSKNCQQLIREALQVLAGR